jgi:hypothetical protein
MPVPSYGHRRPVCLADDTGAFVARVADDGTGVIRLAVDAIVTGGTAGPTQLDNDGVALALTPALVLNENYGFDGTSWRRFQMDDPGTSPIDERLMALYTNAFVRGIDPSAAAGSQGRSVAAREADDDGDFASTFVGLLVNSRIAAWDYQTGRWSILNSHGISTLDGATAACGALCTAAFSVGVDNTGAAVVRRSEARAPGTTPLDERLYGLYSLAFVRGVNSGAAAGSQGLAIEARAALAAQAYALNRLLTDTVVRGDDGSTYSAVACRNFDAAADVANTLIGLVVNSRGAHWDNVTADWSRDCGTSEVSVAGTLAEQASGKYFYQPRESGFAASQRGKRFAGCNQTPGTELTTPSTAYDATKPAIMLRINSASIRAIVRRVQFMISTVGGASPVFYALVLDAADRYSAGAGVVTPQNMNEESATAAVALLYETPTATAAGAGTRVISHGVCANTVGVLASIDLSDGVLMGPTASTLMLYVWTGTSAVKVVYDIEWEEVT